MDFKIHLRKVFEAVCSGVKQNQELSTDIGYVLSKLSCQDSRVDDIDRDIKEMIGKIDRTVEDVQKLVNMNQCNHCQETLANGV